MVSFFFTVPPPVVGIVAEPTFAVAPGMGAGAGGAILGAGVGAGAGAALGAGAELGAGIGAEDPGGGGGIDLSVAAAGAGALLGAGAPPGDGILVALGGGGDSVAGFGAVAIGVGGMDGVETTSGALALVSVPLSKSCIFLCNSSIFPVSSEIFNSNLFEFSSAFGRMFCCKELINFSNSSNRSSTW